MRLLEIQNLTVNYYTLTGIVNAVDRVTLDVGKGEWISVVGESGSGKSTMAYAVIGLVPPPGRIAGGKIVLEGKELTSLTPKEMRMIRGRDIGMVFQDPMTSLDPLRRIGHQVAEVLVEHGVAEWDEALERAKEMLKRVGIPEDRADYYPHQLSGGQRQRVAIAIAMVLRPKLLIADEPTTALDVIVQDTIMDLMEEFKREGTSIMLITHDLALASERSDRIAVMYAGRLVELGPVDSVVESPAHPYTQMLLRSVPDLWGPKDIKSIPGFPPDLRNPPSGCRFHPRCPYATSKCSAEEPSMAKVGPQHYAACHYAEKLEKQG